MYRLHLVPNNTKIQFMKGRFAGLIVSAVLSIASVILFFYPGLNYGIDFRGGTLIELRMPSLREMREDIPPLAEMLLLRLAGGGDSAAPRLSADAVLALQKYGFPGNVRELENVLERALTLASSAEITGDDLQLTGAYAPGEDNAADLDTSSLSLPEKLESMERKAIMVALEKTRYNRTAAAKLLGVSFRALRYRMDRLGIKDELDQKR